jgi:hypothetical protein
MKRAHRRRRSTRLWLAMALTLPSIAGSSSLSVSAPLEPQLTALLQRHTRAVDEKVGTRVDYAALAGDPAWQGLLATLADVDPGALGARNEKLAFWINAYNILAIDLIVQNRPIASIRDIGWALRPVWKQEAGRIGGRGYSLDEIEHRILRPMGEPRIHAAIVCAANSCPNLRREAYRSDGLDAQLADKMRDWLARPEKGMRLDRERGVLHLSRIFEWFDDDFEGQGGVVAVVTHHAPERDREWLRLHAAALEIEYLDYDWQLNE